MPEAWPRSPYSLVRTRRSERPRVSRAWNRCSLRPGTTLRPRPLMFVPSPRAPARQRAGAPWAVLAASATTWHRAGAALMLPNSLGPHRGRSAGSDSPAGPARWPGHGSGHVVTVTAAF